MATYNGERYLREQLDSILTQTISFDEIIICDDASTDSTWKIICEYAIQDSRIKVFRNPENIGVIKNFERVLALCTGDYIAMCDQDDIWVPRHLEILLNIIGDNMAAAGDAEIISAEGEHTGIKLSYCENVDSVPDNDLHKAYSIFFYRGFYYGSSMLVKKKLVNKVLPIPESIHNYHDFWLSCCACFCGGIQNTKEIVTLYRRHPTAVTGMKYRKSRFRTFIGHLLFNRTLKYRSALVLAIRERIGDDLTSEQKDFLELAENYFIRRKTFWGRLVNSIFELKHFKLIYGCK